MKKLVKILGVLLMLLSLTGCLKMNTEMEIKSDKNMTYKAVVAVNKTAIQKMAADMNEGTAPADDDFDLSSMLDEEEYKKAGFATEEYKYTDKDGNEWVGYTISKELGSIDDMLLDKDEVVDMASSSTSGEDSSDLGSDIPAKLFSKNGDVYKAQLVFDLSDTGDTSGIDMSALVELFDLSYQITLPYAAVSNNASEVTNDGKTLKWDLTYGKKTEVNFEFKLVEESDKKDDKKDEDKKDDKNNIILYAAIGGGAGLLLVIILVVVISSKNKKKKAAQAPAMMAPTMDPNMMQPQQPVDPSMMQPTMTPSNMAPQQPVDPNQQPPMQ